MQRVGIICLMILMAAFALIGCRKGSAVQNPQASITTIKPLSQDDVRAAIITACPKTRWVPKDIGKGHIEAAVRVRSHTAVVDIFYTDKTYEIKYKNSVNLTASDGNIHPSYNKWVNTLRHNIDAELAHISARK